MSATAAKSDPARVASELRVVLGQLLRRLRMEHSFPISHGSVLGRLDRCGAQSVSDLAHAEHMRPQSMAQTVNELEADGLIARYPDQRDRRRTRIELTAEGHKVLARERSRREGWLAHAIESRFTAREQAVLRDAVELLRRLAES